MIYLVLLTVAIPIIYLLVKMIQSSSPKGFAKGLAKAQLNSLRVYQQVHPKDSKESQYHAALKMRPGYTDEKVDNIIKGAKEACKESGIKFNFQAVVIQLAAYEYLSRTGNSPSSVMNEVNEGVISIVPGDL